MTRRRTWIAAAAPIGALLTILLLQSGTAGAATSHTLSLDAAGFSYNFRTTHLITGNTPCLNAPVVTDPTEHNGTPEAAGGYLGDVTFPQGAKITAFRFSIEDNDPDIDSYAYLVRKKLTPGSGNFLSGYKVLAQTHSSGAVAGIRRFSTTSISSGTVDTTQYAYLVEIANCGDTVNPVGVQVVYN